MTADPIHAGTAYVVWDRLVAPSHSPAAELFAHAFRGPTWFSKTTDGGKTWTGTRAIFDPGQNSQTISITINGDTTPAELLRRDARVLGRYSQHS